MKLQEFIDSVGHSIFTICFIKRTNGEERIMNCRRGVTKGVTGKGLSFEPSSHNLLVVYDLQKLEEGKTEKGAFRMINLEELIWLRWKGKEWKWDRKTNSFIDPNPIQKQA